MENIDVRAAAMFWLGTFGLALGGCPSDAPDPTPTGKVTITEAGTGDPNAEPLWPLRVGYQARFEAATWFIARDLDRDGTRVFVLQSVVRTPNVVPEIIGALRAETGASESWIGESKDGLLLYGTAGQERLPYAELLVPATVRDGQRWKVMGGGETLGEGVVTGGAVEDTIFGRQRTWTVAFTPTAVNQGGFYATFAEGHGLIALRQGDGPDDVPVPVIAATLPDDAGPAPAPVALTPMRSLSPLGDGAPLATTNTPARAVCGSESGTGFPNVDGGDVLDNDLRARWGFGGTYLSAIERPEGGFRLRLGGYTLTCIAINSGTLSLWYARPLVYSAVLDGDALTLDPKPDRYGHNPENAQDARTSVWRPEGTAPAVAAPAMTGLAFHPVAASGERMTGLFWEPPPDPFTPPAGYQFAHSGIGTLLGPTGNPLSMGFADGIYGMEWYLLPNQTGWWFYPQQPTGQNPAVYWPTGFLPPSAYPLVLASGDFSRDPAGAAGWTPYLTSTFGELTSGQVAYLPEGGYDGTPFTGSAADALRYFARYEYSEARIGSLTADVLSTVLRRDNTRETLLVGLSDGGGIYRLEHDGFRGLRRRLVARPEIPDGHRVTGAFIDGDRVVVSTEAGRMRKTQSASESFLATARPYLWQLPLALAPESELLPAQASATRTGRDVRVCVPEGHERPPLIGWTLGDAGAGAASPAAAVDSGERCIVLVRTAEPRAGREEDAFIAHGPVPGLGLVTLAAGPTAAPTMALGSDDAPPQNDGFPPGWLPDLGGTGAWRLEPTLETDPLTCPTGPCQRLSWRTRAEVPTSRLIGGLTEAPVFLTGGGVLLIAGDTVTVHPPGQLAPSVTRTVPAPPTGDLPSDAVAVPSEVWLPGASLDTTWRCTVTARDQGIEELESIACRRGDGVLAATDRCGRGLATGGSERVQPDGLLRMVTANPAWDDNPLSVGARPDQAEVLWDPTTGQCAVRPIAFIGAAHMDPVTFVITTDPVPAGEADAVQAPDGARFVVEASPPPIFSDPPEPTTWRIYQIQPRHAGRELLAEGSGPDRGYTIVPGRDGVTLWSAGVTNIGTPIPAVLLRHIPRKAPAPCACGLGAICERGACACPDGTTGDATRAPADGGCLAAPGRAAAPAPSCAALPEAPAAGAAVWIDPDGLGGPFVPLPATCDAGLTRPISLVALGRGNEVDLHGAFALDDFALELGLLVLDEPERSPAGNGVGRWSPMDCALSSTDGHYRPIAECAAPGRFALGELNSDTGSYRMRLSDGLTLTSVPITMADPWTETRLSLTRDAAGTLRLSQGGTVLYERATGKLPPLRLATNASGNPVGWRGADCAHVTDPWPSAPALCSCAPLACEARASECGPVDDGCARVQDCGVCASGFDCADNACVCAPDATEALAPQSAAPLVFGTPLPATFHGPDDIDRFSASPFVDKPGDVHYAVRMAGPAVGTSEVVLTLFPTMDGCCCTTTCTTGTQGLNESGSTTCTATVPPGHADATPVVAADVSCAGFQHSDGLVVTARPTAWDAACMPYTLTLERAP